MYGNVNVNSTRNDGFISTFPVYMIIYGYSETFQDEKYMTPESKKLKCTRNTAHKD